MIDSISPISNYVSPGGNDKILEWIEGLDEDAQEAAFAFLRIMQRKSNWDMPDYRNSMSGSRELRQLGEIRWQYKNVQYRIIGRRESNGFLAMVGCVKKQARYNPTDSLDTAERRWRAIRSGEGRTARHDF